jgi:hypothetical protein
MTINIILTFIVLSLFSSIGNSEYLSLSSGYQYGQHGYLSDAGNLNTQVYGVKLDLSEWRRTQKDWVARGPSMALQQGIDYTYLNATLPIYHWHKHQGIWLDIQRQSQNMEVELTNDETLLTDAGITTPLTSGSVLSAQHTITQYKLYWYEAIQYKAPINIVGMFYYSEASPASSEITGSTATIYDGEFSGYGLTMGRIKDVKGFNFQWRLNLAELDMSFSDSSTNHRAASEAESTAYKFGLDMQWHYRYYLAPYWYLVPQFKLGVNTLFQTQTDPSEIEFKALTYIEAKSWVSIQRRF